LATPGTPFGFVDPSSKRSKTSAGSGLSPNRISASSGTRATPVGYGKTSDPWPTKA
jgi:hypothetical protein